MALSDEFDTRQIILTALVIIVSWILVKWRRQVNSSPPGTRLPPCLPSIPFVGSLPFMDLDYNTFYKFLTRQTMKYGNVFAFNMGSQNIVVLNGYRCIKEALLKKSLHFASRSPLFFNFIRNPERKGIIPAPYDEAFRRKRQLYLSILKEFGFGERNMENRINVEVAEFVHQVRLVDGQAFDPSDMLHMCLTMVITDVLFGMRFPYYHPKLKDISDHIRSWFRSVVSLVEYFRVLRFIPPFSTRFKKYTAVHTALLNLVEREVNETLSNTDSEQGVKKNSFVRRFVESTTTDNTMTSLRNAQYDRKELIEILLSFLLGSADTSSAVLRWLIVELANRPDVQSRLHKEIDSEIGRDRLPELADELRLPYLRAVVMETLRRYTVLPISVNRETTCDTQVGDFFLKQNTIVLVNLYSANTDPTEWIEPLTFKPERFLDEHGQITNQDRVVTFGLGKRSCTGEPLARQELFLFVAGMMQNFDIFPPDGDSSVLVGEVVSGTIQPTSYRVRLVARRG